MAREFFRDKAFREDARRDIAHCNTVIRDYLAQGLRLTLRQLYYQLVTKNLIPNSERSYKRLGVLVSDARLAGLMDWDAIEDRVRQPQAAPEFEDLADLTEAAIRSYRLPRWEDQDYYVELWVEKDALAGVLWPLAREHHVTLMVNRGYSSQSAMYESAARFREQCQRRDCWLLYLGDHDPSGEDMVRDIRDRMAMFGAEIEVRKIGLTMAQVRQHRPPPNPAKITDPRAGEYIAKHGRQSWEVDALPPNVLAALVRSEIGQLLDRSKYDAVIAREDADKERLRKAARRLVKGGKP